jgi:hypothetical protein
MAHFTPKELRRRRARLQDRLEYLQARAAEENRPGHSYIAQEASALQTALVLYDEEIERAEAGGIVEVHAMHREGPLRCSPWRVTQYGAVRLSNGQRIAIVYGDSGTQIWAIHGHRGSDDLIRGTGDTLLEAMALADAELRARGFVVEGCVTYRAPRREAAP